MTLTSSFPTDRTAGLPVGDTRLIVAGMVACDATGTPRAGIFPAHYNPIVTGTSGMAYSVAAFQGVASRSGVGAELVANDGAVSVSTTAAPGANSRIDVIWVRSLYTTYADGSSDPVFGVTQGAAAASPTKPSIPAGALELATAVVLSTTTQTSTVVITQTHPYTAMQGGVVALRTQAEQDAWSPANGSVAYRIDTAAYISRIGGAWQAESAITPSSGVNVGSVTFLRRDGKFVEFGFEFSPTTGSWSAAKLVGVLPAGFRPVAPLSFTHQSYDEGFANVVSVGQILTNGEVRVNQTAASAQIIARGFVKFKAA